MLIAPRASRQAGKVCKHRLGGAGTLEHCLGFDQEQPAGLRERNAAADAIEELDRMAFFEGGNGRARGRLRQVQVAGCLGNMLMLGYRDKDAKLFKGHDRDTRA
jgi:hypothetical protein